MESTKSRILLLDDSENLRYVIKEYLEMEGFEVVDFDNVKNASKAFNKNLYDLCIVDVESNEKESFAFMQEARKIEPLIPVVMISSNNTKEIRIKAFKHGCDDFITKPFSIEELELRIRAILRRCNKQSASEKNLYNEVIYKMGNFTFDYSALQLIHPKETRELTRKEAELLKLLIDHKNKLIPREIIMKEVWGEEDHAIGRSMDVFLTKLRAYILIDSEEHVAPKEKGKRKIVYLDGYVPTVEIVNAHGTGFMLKINE